MHKAEKDPQLIIKNLEKEAPPELKDFLAVISLRAEVDYEENPEEEIQLCLAGLKSIGIKNELKRITEELRMAEEEKNQTLANELMEKFNQLTKEI